MYPLWTKLTKKWQSMLDWSETVSGQQASVPHATSNL